MPQLHRPAFNPWWRVTLVRGEAVFFTAERDSDFLEHEAFQAVAPLINGKRTMDAIVRALGTRDIDRMARAFYAIYELQRRGCVQEFARAPKRVTTDEAARILRRAIGGGVRLVFTADYLDPKLSRWNEEAIRRKKPWCPVKIAGKEIWAGPIFVPGETACWSCLAHRLRVTRPIDAFISANSRRAVLLAQPATVTPLELKTFAKAIATDARDSLRDVLTFDLASHSIERHVVQRRSQCPVCGDVSLYSRQLTRLDRMTPPSRAAAVKMTSFVSHVSGLTAAIRPTPADVPAGVHVYDAAPSWAAAAPNMTVLRMALTLRSVGTASTRSRARRTAICEVVERYCASDLGDEPAVRASLRRLGARGIHPNSCMLFSEAQYRHAHRWNARRDAACGVPRPFDPDAVIDWTALWSLTSGEQRYLPTTLLFNGSTRRGRSMCSADTNGNAAGDTLDDAIVRGFLELAERDAIAVWWYNRVPRPRLVLESFDDRRCEKLCVALRKGGRDAWLLDLTTDLSVPTYAAISRRLGAKPDEILMGFGAHFEPESAALHAMHEMVRQVGLTGALQTSRTDPAPLFAQWIQSASLEAHAFLLGDGSTTRTQNLPVPRDRLTACVEIASRANVELLVLDLTRPDIGVPVVRVVAPGLRPAYARLAAGRLYDVPVQMRWRESPSDEESLNDFPFFL